MEEVILGGFCDEIELFGRKNKSVEMLGFTDKNYLCQSKRIFGFLKNVSILKWRNKQFVFLYLLSEKIA